MTRGIQRIASGEVSDDNKEIRFLGTIITVVEPNRNHIYPVEIQAVPPRIEKLIDGQQRVSTIALMATLLTKRLTEIKNKVKSNNPIYDQVNEICNIWIDQKLSSIFSFDLGRGIPKLKPKIIRGAKDYWTRSDDADIAYKSELSNYLGHFIKAHCDKTPYPCLSKDKYGNTLLFQNGKRIEGWLKKVVSTAHEDSSDEFASAESIIDKFSQEFLWEFERPELVDIISEKNFADKKSNSYILCELVQTLSVCHYLLDRCCFTIIQPTDDDWAFDMFQSLNATGTPLTAIETFKPTVVNTIDGETGYQFKDSVSDMSFKKVEEFLSEATTAQQKNKRTNDYLTSFFVAYDGRTMSTHFSYQRKVLNNVYTALDTIHEKEYFVKRLGNYAIFYQYWLKYDGKDNTLFPGLGTSVEADLASMLILFLKASNHKMAITMLASTYSNYIEHTASVTDFISLVKAVAAYYLLWRSTSSNSGLDSTYREFFKQNRTVSIEKAKAYLQGILNKKGIASLQEWKNKARNYLKYDSTGKDVIRLALLISSHDTIPDGTNSGLITIGREGCSKYLCVEKWLAPDLRTIEHIAPQVNKNKMWDENLYTSQIELYQSIGNLTLLPQDLNSSAGNKGWTEKLLYYKSVAERDLTQLNNIEIKAKELDIDLNPSTIELLKNSKYNEHLSSISSLSYDYEWNREIVEKRTDIILDIIWNRVSSWID